jgi:hypothetical protein
LKFPSKLLQKQGASLEKANQRRLFEAEGVIFETFLAT